MFPALLVSSTFAMADEKTVERWANALRVNRGHERRRLRFRGLEGYHLSSRQHDRKLSIP